METPGVQGAGSGGVLDQPERLARGISTPLLYFFVLGDVLGSGIYALVGLVAAEVGGAAWAAFALAVAFALLTGLSYAELVTKYPRAAGAALYVNKAFGSRFLSFLVAFCLVAAGVSAAGALARTFGGPYFQEFLAAPTLLVAMLFIGALALLNFRGISASVRANFVMSLVEVGGLLILLAVGAAALYFGGADLGRPFEFGGEGNPVLVALGGATLAFFAVIGFENAANVVEETQNPSRAYPRALLGAILTAGLLYVAVSFVAVMVVPVGQLAGSEGALLEVVREGPLPIPERLFAAIALVAVSNTALVALIMASRVLYGMAREGVMPRVLARTHPRRQTPWVAIALVTAVTLVLLATVEEVGTFADATVAFILGVFILVNLSVLILRRERVDREHFQTPTPLPVLGIVVCVALLANLAFTNPSVYLYCGVLLLVGLALYFVNNAAQRRLDRKTP